MSSDKVTLKIPRPLYKRLKKIIEDTGFSSVNSFVVYVLRDLAASTTPDRDELTPEEIKHIKKRLEQLGYL